MKWTKHLRVEKTEPIVVSHYGKAAHDAARREFEKFIADPYAYGKLILEGERYKVSPKYKCQPITVYREYPYYWEEMEVEE